MDGFKREYQLKQRLERRTQVLNKHLQSANSRLHTIAETAKVKKRRLSKNAPKHIRLGMWLHGRKVWVRAAYISLTLLVGFSLFTEIMSVILVDKNYQLSPQAQAVLGESRGMYADILKYNDQLNAYEYNPGYVPTAEIGGDSSRPKFSASFSKSPEKGVRVDDPVSQTSITFVPDFPLAPAKQVQDRLLYPIKGQNAVKVYTMQSIGFKEDIILNSNSKDYVSYKYKLELAAGTEARLESDGSIGVYGASQALLGNVSTGSDKDAQLLEKARDKSEKTRLLYRIPAPDVREFNNRNSQVKAWFTLENKELTVHASNLKGASYPLSIDPSIYVETAAKLMRGNSETNVDFDVNNELIQKGSTTGARFNSLTSTMALPSARWNHGTAVAGGYIYTIGGNNGSANQSTVHWAKFDPTNLDIDSTNPGEGTCTNWCTSSTYDLPATVMAHSLVAYNGFLYVIGGSDSSCISGNGTGDTGICDTVYIAKLGVNGEPSLWHPTDPDVPDWVYWYRATDLSTEREYTSAVAYNNRMYLLGGRTYSGSATAVTTVEKADILPNGNLGTWSSTGMTALPSANFGHSAQVYNDFLYVIGGNISGTIQNTVQYIKLKSDGTMGSSWTATNTFTTARQTWGGNFSAIMGGYLYVNGGCAAIDAEGECTSTGITDGGTVELASINADGSIGSWDFITGVTNARIGHGLVGWRNTIYSIGGCTAQNTTTGACTTTSTTTQYGIINDDGDISSVTEYQASGAGNCTGADPFDCDLPALGDDASEIGHALSATAIMNGYMYVIGGCADNSTGTECNAGDAVSSNVAYTAISSDGTLHRSPSCNGAYTGSWCVDSTNVINGTDGVAAAGVTVFEGRIYVVGGLDNTADGAPSISSIGVNSDGSLFGPWQLQTFANLGISGEMAYTFAYARANPASASTYPGNIFIFGGCGAIDTGAECDSSNYRTEVYKCNIEVGGLLEESDANDCDTSGQLPIDSELGDETDQGLGLHSGAVYANYIYLVGGYSANVSNRNTVYYAKFDNSNNVVSVDTSAAGGNGDDWKLATSTLTAGRGWGQSFGYNGYLYAIGGYDSSGGGSLIGSIEYAKFDVSTGNISAFQTTSVSLDQRWGSSLVISNAYAYLIGGCDTGGAPASCTSFEPSLQTFRIYNNDSGTPAAYASATGGSLFGTDRFGAGATINNGYIYIAGGCIGTNDCDNATNSVQYAALNDDGTIGTWASTTAITNDRAFGQLEAAGGSLYFIGGQDDSAAPSADIYYTTPNSNGTITSWSGASGDIGDTSGGGAVARSMLSAAVWNNRIYVTGGYSSGPTATDTVFISPQLNSGGDIAADSWTSGTSFNVSRYHHAAIAYANNLYILGGFNGTFPLSDVQFTQINSDGSLDSWTYTTSLPQRIRGSDGFAANGYMYLFGGKLEDTKCNNNTYVAPIAANTTIASGNNPTGIGEWFVTNKRFNTERSGVSAVYNNGKAFVLGGACGVLQSGGTTIVMEDDFDVALDGSMWTSTTRLTVGTACGTIASGNSLNSDGNNGGNLSEAITKDVDVSFGGTVAFYLRIPSPGTGSCVGPNTNNEDVVLEYSTNNGSAWTVIATYQEDGGFDTATPISENIPAGAMTADTRFRWRVLNGDNNADKWAIDNVVVTANTVPPSSQVLFDDFDPSTDGTKWTSTTGMANNTTCGTISSGNSLTSNGGSSPSAITIDTDLRYGGTIEFYLRLPTNSGGGCTQLSSGEDLLLQYSTDSGSNWTTFSTYDRSSYNSPTQVKAVLPQAGWSAAVRFRWIIPNTASGRWAIDDVNISAFQSILTLTGSNRVVHTSLLSQPQVATYSRMIDTDTDVFPTVWLMNGLDNSIGARWNLRYRSMHDLDAVVNPDEDCGDTGTMSQMTTWGADTNFGDVTLGNVEAYVPKNSSGANINCARYYYFLISIDSSRAFGYPEDVTRGPTIDDLTLFFTSDPSKRLRHGSTFTGGEKQPLDSPCRVSGGGSEHTNCPLP